MDNLESAPDRSDQAEHWFQRMQSPDLPTAERAAFERWRAGNPAHAAAYERAEQLFHRAAELRLNPRWREQARMARERTAQAARVRRTGRWSLAAAATLILAVGAAWQAWSPQRPTELSFATAVGERRTLTLEDGSSIVLDTDSAVRVTYSRKERELVLEHGQAEFSVAKQPERPFVVHAGPGAVRALGTRFQIRRNGSAVLVTLLEGTVKVSNSFRATTLASGEQLRFDDDRLWSKAVADIANARHWTRGELVFDGRPLSELIDEMNRYTVVKIRLGSASIKDLPVSGAFYDNDQASLIRALEVGWSLHAERVSPTQIVLSPR
ncbi:MAG: FecR domain-containing protein [Gammaproteobacteria bacterium]